MLNEAELDALQKTHRKIAELRWEGHQVVFRVPSVPEYEGYLRNRADAQAAVGAVRLLSQQILVAYDGDTTLPQARVSYTNGLLVECPGFPNGPEVSAAIMVLAGTVQEEEVANLKKVVTVRSPRTRILREGSPNGSLTAPEGPNSATTGGLPLSGQPSS
jgi:hypothetical protein